MGIDYKKLLPKNIRNGRWGEFIQAIQSIVNDEIYPNKILPIQNQYNIDKATNSELKDIAFMLGFNLKTFNGYTSTDDYLKKEIRTITKRIITKTTRKGYNYIYYIFNLLGDLYPTFLQGINLIPIYDYSEIVAGGSTVQILDQEADNLIYFAGSMTFDINFFYDNGGYFDQLIGIYTTPPTTGLPPSFLDTIEFPALDMEYAGQGIYTTRHLILNYSPKFIETQSTFITKETLQGLKNDVDQFKRITEIMYYQHHLKFDVTSDNVITIKNYKSYDESINSDQLSRLIGVNLDDIMTVKYGNGSYDQTEINALISTSDIDNSILEFDVETEMFSFESNELHVDISPLMVSKNKITTYPISEVGIFDSSGNMLLYSTFPNIEWFEEMYNNIRLECDLI